MPAHIARKGRLSAHLRATADLAREFAAPFGAGDLAAALGMLHDAGKASTAWQRRLLVVEATGGRVVCHTRSSARGWPRRWPVRAGWRSWVITAAWVTGRSSWMSPAPASTENRPLTVNAAQTAAGGGAIPGLVVHIEPRRDQARAEYLWRPRAACGWAVIGGCTRRPIRGSGTNRAGDGYGRWWRFAPSPRLQDRLFPLSCDETGPVMSSAEKTPGPLRSRTPRSRGRRR